MKKKDFEKLKIGDKVTIRTKEEMLKLRNVSVDQYGNIAVVEGGNKCFFMEDMFRFGGKEYEINFLLGSEHIRCKGTGMYSITRKMLRESNDKKKEV